MSQNTINYMKPNTAVVYVGVDVAKATLQVHVQGRQAELKNALAARAKLCQKLQIVAGAHVVCEATGGYEQDLVRALHKAKVPVSVVNPAQVRAAAQAQGQRAKTDRIDAAMLTDYGQRYQPQPTPPASPVQRQLVALTQWLKQLIEGKATATRPKPNIITIYSCASNTRRFSTTTNLKSRRWRRNCRPCSRKTKHFNNALKLSIPSKESVRAPPSWFWRTCLNWAN
jgi:hypothetical protein